MFTSTTTWTGHATRRAKVGKRKRANKLEGLALSWTNSTEVVGERRMLAKLTSIMDNPSHPLHETVGGLSSFSNRLLQPRCKTECCKTERCNLLQVHSSELLLYRVSLLRLMTCTSGQLSCAIIYYIYILFSTNSVHARISASTAKHSNTFYFHFFFKSSLYLFLYCT